MEVCIAAKPAVADGSAGRRTERRRMRRDGPADWQTGRRECRREEGRRIERKISRGIEVCKNYPDLSLLGSVSIIHTEYSVVSENKKYRQNTL